jgi:hypothetical protein
MKLLTLVLAIAASFSSESVEARGRCLVRESEHVSSAPGQTECRILQKPELVEGLFTFPYLGTRSYRVKYWKGSVVVESSTMHTYVNRIINRCGGWLVDKTYGNTVEYNSTTINLENQNLDEKIENEKLLAPISRREMEKKWSELLEKCGASG